MPKVVRKDVDNLNAVVSITIPNEEVQTKLKSELKNIQRKAQIKGFRAGKTPMSFVKKMYGEKVLSDVINETLGKALDEFLKDENLHYLGQPIPSKDQKEQNISLGAKDDFLFEFDLGLAPQFDITEIEEMKFDIFDIKVPQEDVDKVLEEGLERMGESVEINEPIEGKDIITIDAEELDDNGKVKENGWACSFTVLIDEKLNDSVKEELMGKKKNYKIKSFDIFEIEKGANEDYVKKYFLEVGENDQDVEIGKMFSGKVSSIKRLQPAKLDEEFVKNYFKNDDLKTVADAKEFIEADIAKYLNRQAGEMFFFNLQSDLIEKYKLELPDEFLKRWLILSSEQNTAENVDKHFDSFRKEMQWSMIKSKLMKHFEVKVEFSELVDHWAYQMQQQLGGQMDVSMLRGYGEQFLNENEEEYNKILNIVSNDKLIRTLTDKLKFNKKKTSLEDFNALVSELNAKHAAANTVEEHVHTEDCNHDHDEEE